MKIDNTTAAIVNKLKEYEQQGLSYYQATQQLLKLGYNQTQIDDAEDEFKYSEPPTHGTDSNESLTSNMLATTETESKSDTSLENTEDKVGDILLKDTRKKPLPTWLTLWSPSTYGLKIETNTAIMKSGSGRLMVILVTLIISFILTLLVPKVLSPQIINNSQYCGKNSNPDSSYGCIPAKAISYGWPVHGANIKYEVQGRVIGNETSAGVDGTNFVLFFISICFVIFLVDTARTRF